MPVPVIERALALMPHVDFVNAYGLTETSSTIAVLTPDDHRDAIASDDPAVRRRLGSVGRPSPSVEISIRDPFGEPVGRWRGRRDLGARRAGLGRVRRRARPGRRLVRRPATAAGSTRSGFLFIEGRLDDVIVRGGENISPGEIEDVLREHPAVDDVAVVRHPVAGVGRGHRGVRRARSATVDIDELRDWVRGRLRSTQCPGDGRHPRPSCPTTRPASCCAGCSRRSRAGVSGAVSVAVTASAATVRPGDLGELFAAVNGDTATVLGGAPAAAGRRHGRCPAARMVARLGPRRRGRRRRRLGR